MKLSPQINNLISVLKDKSQQKILVIFGLIISAGLAALLGLTIGTNNNYFRFFFLLGIICFYFSTTFLKEKKNNPGSGNKTIEADFKVMK